MSGTEALKEAIREADSCCPACGGHFVGQCREGGRGPVWPGHAAIRALRSAAYRSGLEAAAKVPDEWLKHPSCEPGVACTHIYMAEEVAKRIRSLAAKESRDGK